MANGSYIKLIKGSDKHVFFMFEDGDVKELLPTGWSNIIGYYDFKKEYYSLLESGYKEVA